MPAAPDLSLETDSRPHPAARVCGVDEAGRGPLVGPVVAAAVVLDPGHIPPGIDDSKRLSAARRESVAAALRAAAEIGLGLASVAEIDRLNILGATLLAMRRAIAALPAPVDVALVDGNRLPDGAGLGCELRAVVRGDQRSLSIAAASILAKTRRDAILHRLAVDHPGYGWERNAGYPTREHLDALARLGPTRHHRAGFAPVRRWAGARA